MRTVLQKTVLSLAVLLCSAIMMTAQEPPEVDGQQRARRPNRPNMMRQLGLDRQQMRQLRDINLSWRPMMEGAQRRFRDANRKLDEAIYADHLDETVINERIREVQLSQADLVKLRSTNELSIRKILTPGQLNRFRRLRQSFEEANARPGRQFMQRPDPENRPPIRHD